MKIRVIALIAIISLVALMGCATMHPAAKATLTPFTGIRDLIDAPLVSLTNVFEMWADASDPTPTPSPGVGWSWRGGFNFGVGLGLGYYVFKPFSWLFGGLDYVLGRSLYPNWPEGVSPWLQEDQTWGDLYFPATRALWAIPEP